ncbi:MAG TPA: AI-2E family transporter, partial [Clostridia bacterium]|nr:AI-2E family transporter [Clostridia bacterium]
TDIIPYFGPIIGIVPAIVFASLGGTKKVLWVILVFVVIQQVMSGIVSPKIIGENVGLHPIIIILSLIVAGKFFGIFGLLVAVPVVGIIRVIGKHLMGHIIGFWDNVR